MKNIIKMLCPKCQTLVDFSVNIDQLTPHDDIAKDLYFSLNAKCPRCNCSMYQADYELVNTLTMLNKNGIITMNHCDKCHNEHTNLIENPDIIKDNKKWYCGPYVMIRNLTLDDIFYLGIAIERVFPNKCLPNINKYDSFIKVTNQPMENRSKADIKLFGECVIKTTVQVFTNTTDLDYIRQCNQMLHDVFQIWLNILTEEGLQHTITNEQLHHMSNTAFSKILSNNV